MIVGCCFDGDDDVRTAWEQHDVYADALRLIVHACQDHVTFAVSVLQLPWPERWAIGDRIDHRTLQAAHDLLAAAWRFRTNSVQPALPFDGKSVGTDERMDAWLGWLRAELSAWRGQPRLITLVMTILAEQNQEPSYRAENELAAPLRDRFADVPWRLRGRR